MTEEARVYFEDSREITGSNELEDYTVYVNGAIVGTLLPLDREWRRVHFRPQGLPIRNDEGDEIFPPSDTISGMEDRILEHFNGRKVSSY